MSEAESDQEVEDVADEIIPPVVMTLEMASDGISMLCKTGNGLEYAYIRMEAKYKALTDISILESYIHLRYIDVGNNNLKDLSPLRKITFLLSLKADSNLLREGLMKTMLYLQLIDFGKNKFITFDGLYHPRLKWLTLNYNRYQKIMPSIEAGRLPCLTTLEMRGNKLKTTMNLGLPSLQQLFLADNKIMRLEGLETAVNLATLHLRNNLIEHLDGLSAKNEKLDYINLRKNKIRRFGELRKLNVLPNLKVIVLVENDVTNMENFNLELLAVVPNLVRLDKTTYTMADRMLSRRMLSAALEEMRQMRDIDMDDTSMTTRDTIDDEDNAMEMLF